MKKRYEAPNVEVVKFEYSDQVVAQSATTCIGKWADQSPVGVNDCTSGKYLVSKTNVL